MKYHPRPPSAVLDLGIFSSRWGSGITGLTGLMLRVRWRLYSVSVHMLQCLWSFGFTDWIFGAAMVPQRQASVMRGQSVGSTDAENMLNFGGSGVPTGHLPSFQAKYRGRCSNHVHSKHSHASNCNIDHDEKPLRDEGSIPNTLRMKRFVLRLQQLPNLPCRFCCANCPMAFAIST